MQQQQLDYASPATSAPASDSRQSGYGVAAIVVASLTILWWMCPFAFNTEKQVCIAGAAWYLSGFLVIAAYRQAGRKRTATHAALVLVVVALLFQLLLKPL
jgi:hypothetical protein